MREFLEWSCLGLEKCIVQCLVDREYIDEVEVWKWKPCRRGVTRGGGVKGPIIAFNCFHCAYRNAVWPGKEGDGECLLGWQGCVAACTCDTNVFIETFDV